MSRSHESPGDAYSTLRRPANRIGIVEIILAVVVVYLLAQLVGFEQHTTRIHGDDTPTLALQ
jgi:hypothetical protein